MCSLRRWFDTLSRCFRGGVGCFDASGSCRCQRAEEDAVNLHARPSATLSDCVMFSAAAFEIDQAGMTGTGASATIGKLLTMSPFERLSI
jgi:hypothetical protein